MQKPVADSRVGTHSSTVGAKAMLLATGVYTLWFSEYVSAIEGDPVEASPVIKPWGSVPGGMLYDRVANLPLTVEAVDLQTQEAETSSAFTRATTTVELSGAGCVGRGEDVTYTQSAHEQFAARGPPALAGEYVFAEFSEAVAAADLFPTEPEQRVFQNYRQWAFEAAALDLTLKQADTDLASVLSREYDPVNFVVSTRLGEPPSIDRLDELLAADEDLAFKLDPTPEWDEDLIEAIAGFDRVEILDLKARYEGTDVDQELEPAMYDRLLDAFPEVIIEDPGLTDQTRSILAGHEDRVSWDVDITGVRSIQQLPWQPSWLNIKPSRFGSVESVLDTIEYCQQRDIQLYGGGQFELDVGRGQIQALASLCYADSPNDVAPASYNVPNVDADPPPSPIEPPSSISGFGWD
jgi:hypothetical protein